MNYQFLVFLIGFYIPFILQLFFFRHDHFVIICNLVCFITQTLFFTIEIIQARYRGYEDYFDDFQNKVDMALIFVTYMYIIARMTNPSLEIVPILEN